MHMIKKAYLIRITGIVQSVGFRPFIYRIFENDSGWVKNDKNGVLIYLETELQAKEIKREILKNAPINSQVDKIIISEYVIKKQAFDNFFIRKSDEFEDAVVSIPPDLGICDECTKEMFNENNRRYLHPFINCTNCGPRFSIITGSPYDRNKTTMKSFSMCDECKKEYENPKDRRFHAQPIACNSCGPEYFFIKNKAVLYKGVDAIKEAANMLKDGYVGLVKGIGGYHLICDASSKKATDKIKSLKGRHEKPFAVIAKDIDIIEKYCFVDKHEKALLLSQIKPIVLLKTKNDNLFENIRMGSIYFGVMLPYAPIHLLLFFFSNLEFIVATSANFTEKPLIYNDLEALNFKGVDFVLTNNRKIVRPLEDSIVKICENRQVVYRYARGFAPGVFLKKTKPGILALGGDLKNNIAISFENRIVTSQYTGDLREYDNYLRFEEKIKDFLRFFNFKADIVLCDKHPDYFSTNYALENFSNVVKVQHHVAHFASVLLEYEIKNDCLGIIMDGTGFGDDGNLWGGEFFIKTGNDIERVGHIKYFPFAFSDKAIKEPYRLAILWLLHLGIKNHRLFDKYPDIAKAAKFASSIKTSSSGRLFDVVSALLDIKDVNNYEAEAAISLMNRAFINKTDKVLNYKLEGFDIDFTPALEEIANIQYKSKQNRYAAAFHNTFIDAIISNIMNMTKQTKIKNIALSGGTFQNEIVLSEVYKHLTSKGFSVYFNSSFPINDGSLALGQIWLAEHQIF